VLFHISGETAQASGITSGLLVTPEQRGSVELVRSSNDRMGDFAATEDAFCFPSIRRLLN
jgi:hypothetical protein